MLKGNDLKRAEMRDLITRFQTEAREADAALFYYAGHGFQIEQKNYLVPVDATIKSEKMFRLNDRFARSYKGAGKWS